MSIPGKSSFSDLPNKFNQGIDNVQRRFGWQPEYDKGNPNAMIQRQIDDIKRQISGIIKDNAVRDRKIQILEFKTDSTQKEVGIIKTDITKIFSDLLIKTQEIAQTKIDIKLLQAGLAALAKSIPFLIQTAILSWALGEGIKLIGNLIAQALGRAENSGLLGQIRFAIKLANEAKNDARAAATIAVKAEGKADNALAEIKFVTQSALNAMRRLENFTKDEIKFLTDSTRNALSRLENFTKDEIKFLTDSTRNALLRLQERVTISENIVKGLQGVVDGLKSQFAELQNLVNVQLQRLTNAIDQIKTDLLTQVSSLKLDIGKILGRIGLFAAQIAGLTLAVAGIQALIRAIRPGGNVVNVTNNNFTNIANVTNNTNITNVQQVDNSLLRQIDATTRANLLVSRANFYNGLVALERLGNQITGGLSGWMTRFSNWSVVNRAVQFMTLFATIHNATMLSSNIGQTLIQAMQNGLDFIGLKDSENNPYDVATLINSSIVGFIQKIIGLENYTELVANWKIANRIYQAAGNLFSSLLDMADTTLQALQVVAGQTSKIGNALRNAGEVFENAYGWFNPTPNFSNPLLTKLNQLEETASVVENVSQQPLNVKSAKEDLEESSKQLADSLAQIPGAKQGPEQPEAMKIKMEAMESKDASPGRDVEPEDKLEDDS